MLSDQMMTDRFKEIFDLETMTDSDIETVYGLNPGLVDVNAYRRGVISSICRLTMAELQARNSREVSKPDLDVVAV